MEMKAILKLTVLYIALGVALYFETKVVFNRFATIISIEFKSMLPIEGNK